MKIYWRGKFKVYSKEGGISQVGKDGNMIGNSIGGAKFSRLKKGGKIKFNEGLNFGKFTGCV